MARSKVKGTNGKPRKKGTNRDKLKASVHIDQVTRTGFASARVGDVREKTKRYNDGDPHIYVKQTHKHRDHNGDEQHTELKSKIKDKRAANPIKGKPKGIRGLPAIHRDSSETRGHGPNFKKVRSRHNANSKHRITRER